MTIEKMSRLDRVCAALEVLDQAELGLDGCRDQIVDRLGVDRRERFRA